MNSASSAMRPGSRLTALFAREWTLAQLDSRKTAELGLVPWDKLHLLDESIAASISAVADRHLARHGASVDSLRIEDVPYDAIADRLQVVASAMGADLIVAGAFGHPRLWEKMLGGVTHDLLARMRLPIFMSHEGVRFEVRPR